MARPLFAFCTLFGWCWVSIPVMSVNMDSKKLRLSAAWTAAL